MDMSKYMDICVTISLRMRFLSTGDTSLGWEVHLLEDEHTLQNKG